MKKEEAFVKNFKKIQKERKQKISIYQGDRHKYIYKRLFNIYQRQK